MDHSTHDVINQVPNLENYNIYTTDLALQEAVQRYDAASYNADLIRYGQLLGSDTNLRLAHQINRHAPELQQYDRQGYRDDQIVFHPGWHQFLAMGFSQGLHCSAYSDQKLGAQVARAANFFIHGQTEAGSLCPLTMTAAAIPILQHEDWFPKIKPRLFSRDYDQRDLHLSMKTSMMVGMGMTEKQGGSDLRSNSTSAEPVAASGRGKNYLLLGHKWFFSSPMSDAHLVLATHKQKLSCFYVPRWLDETRKNKVHILRIKDKLGNRSNASVEVEFHQAVGTLIGVEGKGIATLANMASYTRLDCVLGSTALLRQAVVQALHHCHHRHAFGRTLIEHQLMQSVLLDLILESEAATALALAIAAAFDAPNTPLCHAFRRILTPAAKFWVTKRTIQASAECMEIWGGNGYIEDAPMARLYREAPVNSIWEGSGNVMCLDVLRAWAGHPELALSLSDYLLQSAADDHILQPRTRRLLQVLSGTKHNQLGAARYVAQELVLLTQALLLRQYAPQLVSDAFISSRFADDTGAIYGVRHNGMVPNAVLIRAWPWTV